MYSPTIQVQSVIYQNDPANLCRTIEHLANAVRVERESVAQLGRVKLVYGDASPEPVLTEAALSELREKFGKTLAPITIPIMEGDKSVGIVDIIHKEAYLSGGGKTQKVDVPADLTDRVDEYYEFLCEAVAETSEENMEKFFEGEEFTLDEIIAGINQGVKDLSLVPVFCGSAMTGMGTESLIRGLVDFAPNPTEGYAQHAVNEKGEDVTINCAPTETPVIFVFKTVSDQYGKQSYFKVISGNITADLALETSFARAEHRVLRGTALESAPCSLGADRLSLTLPPYSWSMVRLSNCA